METVYITFTPLYLMVGLIRQVVMLTITHIDTYELIPCVPSMEELSGVSGPPRQRRRFELQQMPDCEPTVLAADGEEAPPP